MVVSATVVAVVVVIAIRDPAASAVDGHWLALGNCAIACAVVIVIGRTIATTIGVRSRSFIEYTTEGGWRRTLWCGGTGEIGGVVIRTPCLATVVIFRSVVVVNSWRLVLGFRIITDRRGLVTIAVIVITAVATDVFGPFARFVVVEAVITVIVIVSVGFTV